MQHIYLTTIDGRPKPDYCFLSGRLRWTLLPKKRYGDSLSESNTPTFQLRGRHCTTEHWANTIRWFVYFFSYRDGTVHGTDGLMKVLYWRAMMKTRSCKGS